MEYKSGSPSGGNRGSPEHIYMQIYIEISEVVGVASNGAASEVGTRPVIKLAITYNGCNL